MAITIATGTATATTSYLFVGWQSPASQPISPSNDRHQHLPTFPTFFIFIFLFRFLRWRPSHHLHASVRNMINICRVFIDLLHCSFSRWNGDIFGHSNGLSLLPLQPSQQSLNLNGLFRSRWHCTMSLFCVFPIKSQISPSNQSQQRCTIWCTDKDVGLLQAAQSGTSRIPIKSQKNINRSWNSHCCGTTHCRGASLKFSRQPSVWRWNCTRNERKFCTYVIEFFRYIVVRSSQRLWINSWKRR